MGGAVKAIESGWMKRQISDSAYAFQQQVEREERVIVGVNKFTAHTEEDVEIQRVTPQHEASQRTAVAAVRAGRDSGKVEKDLAELEAAARGSDNVLLPMKVALADYATIGEVFGRLRQVWGVYRPAAEI
jgi:methylmalonyl-CoA mutase N-terminal domain/subunit